MKAGKRRRFTRRPWTADEVVELQRLYPDTPTKKLAEHFGRRPHTVYQKANGMGLRKSAAYLASPESCRLRRGDGVGRAFRFPKGHVPANKGLRRPGWAPGRMRETQFKKGAMAGAANNNWRPVGTEIVDADGYRKVKVSDDRSKASRFNWRFVHVRLWEQHHGPVPRGCAVVFRNGNKADIRTENLELVTRQELMKRNTVHNLPKPVAELVQLRGALMRQINRRSGA